MKITLGVLALLSLLTFSTYATAKKVNTFTLGVGPYSSNNDRNLVSPETPSWQKRGGLLEPRDETIAVVDEICFYDYLKYSRSMSLSQNGNILAVGYETRDDFRCYYTRTGVVEVYEYSFTQQRWIPRGGIISNRGSRTSLSADGNILVTGQYEGAVESGMSGAGVVYAFQYDVITQDWIPMGEILNLIDDRNDAEVWHFGYSVATSGNGQMIAIGHPGKPISDYYTGGGIYDENVKGRTHIYSHNGNATWTKGGEIKGTVLGEELGRIVSLSKDGSVVAMASYYHIEVYQMNAQDEWVQLGADIEGSPESMALSTNGRYISAVFLWPDRRVVYKYSSSNGEWAVLLENDTWVSGSDIKVLSIIDDDEEIFFKFQGASASSSGPSINGPTIVAPNEEGNGIQTKSFSVIIDTQSPTPAAKVRDTQSPTPAAKVPTPTTVRAPVHTPLGKGKGSKSKGSKSKNTKSKGAKSDKSKTLKSEKQPKEPKSLKHASYSKKSGKKSAK